MKPKELSQHGISSRGRQGCSAIPISQQCTLGLQGTHCASRAAVPIPSWALQIAGVTATQCSKSSTPLSRGNESCSPSPGCESIRCSRALVHPHADTGGQGRILPAPGCVGWLSPCQAFWAAQGAFGSNWSFSMGATR